MTFPRNLHTEETVLERAKSFLFEKTRPESYKTIGKKVYKIFYALEMAPFSFDRETLCSQYTIGFAGKKVCFQNFLSEHVKTSEETRYETLIRFIVDMRTAIRHIRLRPIYRVASESAVVSESFALQLQHLRYYVASPSMLKKRY